MILNTGSSRNSKSGYNPVFCIEHSLDPVFGKDLISYGWISSRPGKRCAILIGDKAKNTYCKPRVCQQIMKERHSAETCEATDQSGLNSCRLKSYLKYTESRTAIWHTLLNERISTSWHPKWNSQKELTHFVNKCNNTGITSYWPHCAFTLFPTHSALSMPIPHQPIYFLLALANSLH